MNADSLELTGHMLERFRLRAKREGWNDQKVEAHLRELLGKAQELCRFKAWERGERNLSAGDWVFVVQGSRVIKMYKEEVHRIRKTGDEKLNRRFLRTKYEGRQRWKLR